MYAHKTRGEYGNITELRIAMRVVCRYRGDEYEKCALEFSTVYSNHRGCETTDHTVCTMTWQTTNLSIKSTPLMSLDDTKGTTYLLPKSGEFSPWYGHYVEVHAYPQSFALYADITAKLIKKLDAIVQRYNLSYRYPAAYCTGPEAYIEAARKLGVEVVETVQRDGYKELSVTDDYERAVPQLAYA